ncbi:MAG: M23 family metallopeptidase [Candidatus Thorarchaeota archaeon]|nr:M23 family metallopeptidase [Candidatus Thorarchaeota archaeon]
MDAAYEANPRLKGFLSDCESEEKVVSVTAEPTPIFFEEARNALELNFDFVITGLTDRRLQIRFIKAAVYDPNGNLVTYRHLNHNGVGTPGIHTIGRYELNGRETLDVFNPFHHFPKDLPMDYLRYMFTFYDLDTKEELYYGNIIVRPQFYRQRVSLSLPLKGLLTVIDGHDFYSHHRRFAMSIVRNFTGGKFQSNFSRYAIDFTLLGDDGNTRRMTPPEYKQNYDFHFDDARRFYTDGAEVLAPADGEIVDVVGHLDDLYDSSFDMEHAVKENRVEELAGNYVVIRHNSKEYSHLYHLQKNSIVVEIGEEVSRGQAIAKIGFSGAATVYSHLHYQLMDGMEFLTANPLPCKFSDVTLLLGSNQTNWDALSINTGDFIVSE